MTERKMMATIPLLPSPLQIHDAHEKIIDYNKASRQWLIRFVNEGSDGFRANRAGVPGWRSSPDSKFGNFLYIVFPGNAGNAGTLMGVYLEFLHSNAT